jgi:hypothetical protein
MGALPDTKGDPRPLPKSVFHVMVLRKFGFASRWCDLICGQLTSSSTQVFLNGIPGDFIQHRRFFFPNALHPRNGCAKLDGHQRFGS